jgi:ABC-type multidrug transport system fused ATPase/permease subunit
MVLAMIDATQQVGIVEEALRVLGRCHEIEESADALTLRGPDRYPIDIAFNNVAITYGNDKPVLRNVSVVIRF